MLGVLVLAIGVAIVALVASVSLIPTRAAFATANENQLGPRQLSITDLGTLPGGTFSIAYGINNHGQVVGYSDTASGEGHAFLWQKGEMTDLGTLPGGTFSIAYGINDGGQAVGASDAASSEVHAVMWSK